MSDTQGAGHQLFRDDAAGGVAVLVVGRADPLGTLPGDLDLDVLLAGGERALEVCTYAFGPVHERLAMLNSAFRDHVTLLSETTSESS